VAIAYQVVGGGPPDVVFFRGFTGDLLSTWDQPLLVRHIEGLAANGRLIMLDRRGSGLSDRTREVPSVESAMDDIRAVLDAIRSDRAVLWSGSNATGIALMFAATYPERTAGIVLFDPAVRGTRSEEYPWAPSEEEWRARLASIRTGWGERAYLEDVVREWAPELADDEGFRTWFVDHLRRSLTPGSAVTSFRAAMELDVSDLLSAVRVPVLVMPRPADPGPGHYLAARIRGAEIAELPPFPGRYTWIDDASHRATMDATAAFIRRLARQAQPTRVLATLLFTDIVGSTERAAALGDGAWRELLRRHHAIVRRELASHGGRELDTAGDGFFASFDGPAKAVRAATSISAALGAAGIPIRAGIHTGECEVNEEKLAGIAVSIAARISGLAGPGEVLVSSTVRDLVAGSGIAFTDRGEHELKGVPDAWRLYVATSS